MGLSIAQAPTQTTANPLITLISWVRTSAFGQSHNNQFPPLVEPNNEKVTRLPIEVIQPSIWSRIWQRATNFFSWRFFYNPGQAKQTSESKIHKEQFYPQLSPEVSALLVSRLDTLRKEHERKTQTKALAHLKYEEKQKEEVLNFADQMNQRMLDFSTAVNARLNSMNSKLNNLSNKACVAKSPTPQLPVIVIQDDATQTQIDEWIINFDRKLSELKQQQELTLELYTSPKMEIFQSNLPQPKNTDSIDAIDHIAGSFSELPLTPSSSPEPQEVITPKIQYQNSMYSPIGLTYLQKVLTHNQIEQMSQADYLHSIIGLTWHLYDHAAHKNEKFDEGTFVIEDKDFKIYNFLMNYVQSVNPTITGTNKDPLSHYSDNPFAYSRDASHFIDQKKKYRPYGIDIRFGAKGAEKQELPANKKHLLFGICNFDKQLIYIKPENHGLYYQDGLLGHIAEFASAQARKDNRIANAFRAFCGWFGIAIGTDDADSFRKERIPKEFLVAFALNLKAASFSDDQKQAFLAQAKKSGLQTLCNPALIQSSEFQNMLTKYRAEYDNLENRTGREVFLSHEELQRAIAQ